MFKLIGYLLVFFLVLNILNPTKENYTWRYPFPPSPYTKSQRKHFASTYLGDRRSPSFHRYPFAGYSLYGYDDLPVYHYYWDNNYPDSRYPQEPWSKTVARRNLGHNNLSSLDYVGLPSYFYRNYYRWPNAEDKQN